MKFHHLIPLFLLTLPCACDKSGPESRDEAPELEDVTLQVSLPSLSKAGLEDGACVWEVNDSISVWDGYGVRVFRTSAGGSGTSEFTGSAVPAEKYYVVYPAGSCHSYAPGKADVVIPEIQKANPGSFSPGSFVCYGVTDGGKVSLDAVGSVLEIEIERGARALSGVVVKGSDADVLSGYMVITSEPAGVDPVMVGMKNSVRLVPSEGESFIKPGKYYFSVVPTPLENGLDVEFESGFYPKGVAHVDGLQNKLSASSSVKAGSFDSLKGIVEEEADDTAADPSSAYGLDFSLIPLARHPRLIAGAEDFVALKSFIQDPANASSVIAKMHNVVMIYADAQLAKTEDIPLPDGAKSDVLGDVAREAVGRLLALSYAWRLTGDEKYLTKARSNLSRVCSFSNWYPQSYLSTAELQFAASIAYDWLYYDLTLAERSAAHAAIRDLGLASAPADHISKQDNWNSVCNAGLLYSALSIYEKDKAVAAYHIDKSIQVNIPALDVMYGNDGAYPEGYGYWDYGTEYQVALTQGLLSIFGSAAGIDTHEGFRNTGEYMLYMSDAVGTFSYSDGGRSKASPRLPQWWFAARNNRGDLLFNELPLLENGSYINSSRFLPLYPLYLIKYPALDLSAAVKPSKDIWSGNGVAPMVMVHTGWNGNSSDSYIAAKGGAASGNHGHMDAGSFVFDFNGVRWVDEILLTGGYAPYENALYAIGKDFWNPSPSSYRWDVFVMNNLAHPTLSFANNDGSVSGKVHDTDHYSYGKATLSATIDSESEKGGTFDMTEVFTGQVASAKRTVVLRGGSEAVITDEIKALPTQDASLIWTAPTSVPFTVDDDCIELLSGKKEMYLWVESSLETVVPVFQNFGHIRPAGKWGWVARDWDQTISAYDIMGYTATIPAGASVRLVTTISPQAPGQGTGGAENEKPEM